MTEDPIQTLVVEDDEDQRVLLTRILESRGHEVVAGWPEIQGPPEADQAPWLGGVV